MEYDFAIEVYGVRDLYIEDARTTWGPDVVASYIIVTWIFINVLQSPFTAEAIEHCA